MAKAREHHQQAIKALQWLPPLAEAVLGGALAPAVDLGTWAGLLVAGPAPLGLLAAGPALLGLLAAGPALLGLLTVGPALLVAVPAAAAAGGFDLTADVSTFSGSLGLRAAACIIHTLLLCTGDPGLLDGYLPGVYECHVSAPTSSNTGSICV